MTMRPMSHNALNINFGLLFVELGREDPEAVPQIIPDRKERGRDELANVRTYAASFQSQDDEVIQNEINKCNKNVPTCNFGLMILETRAFEYPVAL